MTLPEPQQDHLEVMHNPQNDHTIVNHVTPIIDTTDSLPSVALHLERRRQGLVAGGIVGLVMSAGLGVVGTIALVNGIATKNWAEVAQAAVSLATDSYAFGGATSLLRRGRMYQNSLHAVTTRQSSSSRPDA